MTCMVISLSTDSDKNNDRLWLNVDLSINDLYGNQFVNRFRQK